MVKPLQVFYLTRLQHPAASCVYQSLWVASCICHLLNKLCMFTLPLQMCYRLLKNLGGIFNSPLLTSNLVSGKEVLSK